VGQYHRFRLRVNQLKSDHTSPAPKPDHTSPAPEPDHTSPAPKPDHTSPAETRLLLSKRERWILWSDICPKYPLVRPPLFYHGILKPR